MATASHCAYCFEVLSAKLKKSKPLSLADVEQSWSAYEISSAECVATEDPVQSQKLATTVASTRLPAINKFLSLDSSGSLSSSTIHSASSSTPSLIAQTSSTTSLSSIGSGNAAISNLAERSLDGKEVNSSHTDKYPLFVTWDTRDSNETKTLRGCIGTFEPYRLEDGLSSYALTAALEDTRFMPISSREISSLQCSVTLLTNFELAKDRLDWELGVHGIRINFMADGRRYGATYLPDVAVEQRWSKQETLFTLMRKAGWNGSRSECRDVDLYVTRYQGQKMTLSYEEWRLWKDWTETAAHGYH